MELLKTYFFRHFATTCLLCGSTSPHGICEHCIEELPWITQACHGCGLPLAGTDNDLLCGECLQQPSPFAQVVIPFHYRPPISPLITGFKHRDQLLAGYQLGELLQIHLQRHYRQGGLPDLILPVPLHRQRWQIRGYNQSEELGRQLAGPLGLPCCPALARRIRCTTSQQGLGRDGRLLNQAASFSITRPLQGQCIALVDDVVTTGSTARTLAYLLKEWGAGEVHLWALARTPRENG